MELKLPELGEGVHEGELVKWNVKAGEMVKEDQSICEIMTDKATVDLPSPFNGKVLSLNAKEGDVVKVGQTMLTFEGKGASASVGASAAPAATSSHSAAPAVSHAPAASMSASSMSASNVANHDILAAPSTRRFAREQSVELSQVPATGPHGRILRDDVEKFIAGGVSSHLTSGAGAVAAGKPTSAKTLPLPTRGVVGAAQPDERLLIKGLRKKISEKMRLSKDKAAHFTYVEEADATQLVAMRNQAKEMGAQYGIKVTYLPFVMKAMVAALRKYPHLNANMDDSTNELVVKKVYNISLSIQTDDGLTAPVVKDVGNKSILEIARDIQNLVEKARAKKLTMDDLQGGTITLTNAGSIGGLFATPVINYPEVAILGFNKIFRKPVAKVIKGKEKVVIRDWTYFSISLDHRVIDGAVAAEFMKTFIEYIENPNRLLMESI